MSPGPSLALVIHHTLGQSPRHVLAAALSHGTGVAVYAALTVAGLGLLLAHTPWLSDLVAGTGALYLLYLAARAWQAPSRPWQPGDAPPTARSSTLHAAVDGFLMAFLNPKIGLFFLARFSQFIQARMGLTPRVAMVAMAGIIDAGWYSAVSLGLTHTRAYRWLTQRPRLAERTTALLLAAIAIAILVPLLA